jgi:TM2 domain-containing membrane protein YozV
MFTWYYVGQFGQLGPLSEEQMIELAQSGVIEADTYVWKVGMPEWVVASSVPDLRVEAPLAGPPPLPTPPKLRGVPATVQGSLQVSPCNRILAGLLQLIPGVGRLYMGYLAVGVLQLVLTVCSCGILWPWALIDGVMILAGSVKVDGYGRLMPD